MHKAGAMRSQEVQERKEPHCGDEGGRTGVGGGAANWPGRGRVWMTSACKMHADMKVIA